MSTTEGLSTGSIKIIDNISTSEVAILWRWPNKLGPTLIEVILVALNNKIKIIFALENDERT